MKRKSEKSNIALLKRRKPFRAFLATRLIIGLILAIAIFMLGITIFGSIVKKNIRSAFYMGQTYAYGQTTKTFSEATVASIPEALNTHYNNVHQTFDIACALYNVTTGQLIASTSVSPGTPGIDISGICTSEDILFLQICTRANITSHGESYVLISECSYGIMSMHRTKIIFAGVITFTLAFTLSYLAARAAWERAKAAWDMEDYRNTLINTLAHDLKSPLMSIGGYGENILANINPDKYRHYCKGILDNALYMQQLIQSVVILSDLDNKAALQHENVDISAIINQYLTRAQVLLSQKELAVEISGTSHIMADKNLLNHAIDNLLTNAIKHSVEKSTIRITLSDTCMEFSNQCKQLPEASFLDNPDSLCQPFVTGDSSRSNKSGNGLGLAIVKNICDLHKFILKINIDDNRFVATILTSK